MGEFPPVRSLGPDDLKSLMALAVGRGWLPEKRKWCLLLETSEIFGADAPDGDGLAGSVTLTRYGRLSPGDGKHASVGMMLVAARYGRRGLGRALMTHLLGAVGDATVTLFATGMGRPLYERLGFKATGRSVSFAGRFRPGPGDPAITTRPATEADLPAIMAIDRAAFGADRSHILRRLPAFAEKIIIARTPGGNSGPAAASPEAAGYGAAWFNGRSTVIGPVVAPDTAVARALITELAAGVAGPVRLDLDADHPDLPAWAQARGLEPGNLNTTMVHGPWNPPGARDRILAPITVAMT